MEAITILKRYREAKSDLERLDQQIQRRWDAINSLSASRLDPNGGGHGSGDKDKTGRILGDIDDLERQKKEREQDEAVELASACTLLDMVPDREGTILNGYYIRRENTAQIAMRLHFSEVYIRKTKRGGEKLLGLLTRERVHGTLPKWYIEKHDKRG